MFKLISCQDTPYKRNKKMTTFLRKINTLLKYKNLYKLHIPHIHSAHNNEHHRLITYSIIKEIFKKTIFHPQEIGFQELNIKNVPFLLKKILKKTSFYNKIIIITVRKALFKVSISNF